MPALQHVYLRNTGVSSENLLVLRDSPSLSIINISKEELTKDEVDAVKQKFEARGIGFKTSIHRH
jgi:hypothetical protein